VESYIEDPKNREVNNMIMRLKDNSLLGENNVESVRNEIWRMIKVIWKKEIIPEEWNTKQYYVKYLKKKTR